MPTVCLVSVLLTLTKSLQYKAWLQPYKLVLRFVGILVHTPDMSVAPLGESGENPYYLKAQKKLERPTNWKAIRQCLEWEIARETTVLTCTSAEIPLEGLGSRWSGCLWIKDSAILRLTEALQ